MTCLLEWLQDPLELLIDIKLDKVKDKSKDGNKMILNYKNGNIFFHYCMHIEKINILLRINNHLI
jgi:hypothetical protein